MLSLYRCSMRGRKALCSRQRHYGSYTFVDQTCDPTSECCQRRTDIQLFQFLINFHNLVSIFTPQQHVTARLSRPTLETPSRSLAFRNYWPGPLPSSHKWEPRLSGASVPEYYGLLSVVICRDARTMMASPVVWEGGVTESASTLAGMVCAAIAIHHCL